jgi:hypothetical protein
MNFLFYDIVPSNIIRFFSKVVFECRKNVSDSEFYFLYEHDDEKNLSDVKLTYPFAKDIAYSQWKNIEWFEQYLRKNKIHVLFINGQRIADDRVVLIAKRLGIKTYMLQHGMYIPFLKRNFNFFTSQAKKTLSYFYYAYLISKQQGFSYSIIFKYIRSYVFGSNQVEVGINRVALNVDKVFVYSDFWKEFHRNQFGYSPNDQVIVGTPDLQGISEFLLLPTIDNTVCYIAQTLVEDGRLDRKTQVSFYKSLVDLTHNMKLNLVVKLHPRSDLSLFDYSNDHVHIELLKSALPKTSHYIGHYSTLLSKAMCINDSKIIIFEYKNHPTPDYFKQAAHKIVNEVSSLNEAFLDNNNASRLDITFYFEHGDKYTDKIISTLMDDKLIE